MASRGQHCHLFRNIWGGSYDGAPHTLLVESVVGLFGGGVGVCKKKKKNSDSWVDSGMKENKHNSE